MQSETTASPRRSPIVQFTVFSENKVGRLRDVLQLFAANDLHIIALTQLDFTDFAAIRLIINYPDLARQALQSANVHFLETPIIAVELNSEADLKFITTSLVEAEINIHYLYPFLSRPNNKSALALHLEDPDLAASILASHGFKCLDLSDIAR